MSYKAVFHVDQNDNAVMHLALNNITNLLNAIPHTDHDLVVVLNGPAANLLTCDNGGPFLEQIKELAEENVRFQVCKNAMKNFNIQDNQLIDECDVIPAGVVALINLQNDAFAYIKP